VMYRARFGFKPHGYDWHYHQLRCSRLSQLISELQRLESWALNQGFTFTVSAIQKG
jgi:hypothetical protein